mgnify:CR=1 FL=1
MSLKFHEMTIDAYLPLSVLRLPLPAAVLLRDSSEHRPVPWEKWFPAFLPPERILMISVKKRSSMLPFLNRPALFSWI